MRACMDELGGFFHCRLLSCKDSSDKPTNLSLQNGSLLYT
jgi:hypothetical protein